MKNMTCKRFTSLLLAVLMVFSISITSIDTVSFAVNDIDGQSQAGTGSYSLDGDIRDVSPHTMKQGEKEFTGEYVDEPYFLTENQLSALDELVGHERPVGLSGFEDYDLTGTEMVRVIVEFVTRPAKVEQAIDLAAGKSTMEVKSSAGRLVVYEAKALADHIQFRTSLKTVFSTANANANTYASTSATAYSIDREYHEAFNGVAMRIPANKIEEIAKLDSVQAIYPDMQVTVFSYENVAETFDSAEVMPEMNDTREFLGVNDLHDRGIKGAGVLVGVIDTGVDYTHPDLKDAFLDYDPSNPGSTEMLKDGKYYGRNFVDDEYIDRAPNDPMESSFEEYLSLDINIPFIQNGPYTTEHGTHVSGEIVGRGTNPEYSVLGIAPEANLVVYRVLGPFGTGDSGAILSGVEQSILDGCDVVNMSLGVNENTPYFITSLAVNYTILAHDIVFCVAAANSGPRASSLGSPSTAMLAITIGAISVGYEDISIRTGDEEFQIYKLLQDNTSYFEKDGDAFGLNYQDLNRKGAGSPSYSFYVMPSHDNPDEIGTGTDADWTSEVKAAAKGNIVVVRRGNTYLNTVKKAIEAGAGGLLVLNSQIVNGELMTAYTNESYIGQNKNYLPVFGMNETDAERFLEIIRDGNTTFRFTDVKEADIVAGFSSRGPVGITYDIKPDLVSPGVAVYSGVPYFYHDRPGQTASTPANHGANSYEYMRGTSMASPQTAGLVALMLSEDIRIHGEVTLSALEVKARLMNSADAEGLKDGFGVYDMGAGRVHLDRAIETDVYITAENSNLINETRTAKEGGGYTSGYEKIDGETASISFGSVKAGQGLAAQEITKTATIHNLGTSAKTFELSYAFNTAGTAVVDSGDSTITMPERLTVDANSTLDFEVTITLPADFMQYGSVEGYIYLKCGDESYRLPFALYATYKGIDQTGEYLGFFVMNMPIISTSPDTRQMEYSSISGAVFSVVQDFDYVVCYFSKPETPDVYIGTTGHMNVKGSGIGDMFYYPNLLRGYYWDMLPDTDYTDRSFYNDYKYFESGEYIMTSIALLGEDMSTAEVVDSFRQIILVDNDAPRMEIVEKSNNAIRGTVYDAGIEKAMELGIYWPTYENEPVTDYSFMAIFLAIGDELLLAYPNTEGAFYFDISDISVGNDDEIEMFVFDYYGPRRVPYEIAGAARQSMDFDPYALSFSNFTDAYSSPNMTIYSFKSGDQPEIDFDYAGGSIHLESSQPMALSPRLTLIPSIYDLTWTSSNDQVVMVDDKGVITGLSDGTATITASWKNVSSSIEVTVNNHHYFDFSGGAGVSINAGDGVYLGSYAYALSTVQYGYLMGNLPFVREETVSPILWYNMGKESVPRSAGHVEGDDVAGSPLTLLSKYIIDFMPYSGEHINGSYSDSGVNRFLHREFLKGFNSGEDLLIQQSNVVVPRNVLFTGERNTTDRTYGLEEQVYPLKFYLPWADGNVANPGIYWSAGPDPIKQNTISAVLGDAIAEVKENPGFVEKQEGDDWSYSYMLRNPSLLHTLIGNAEYGSQVTYWNRTPSVMTAPYSQGTLSYIENGAFWGVRPVTKIIPENIVYAYEITKDGGLGKVEANRYYEEGTDGSKNYKLTIMGADGGAGVGTLDADSATYILDTQNLSLTIENIMPSQTSANYVVAYKVIDESENIVAYGELSAADVKAQGKIVINNLPKDIESTQSLKAYYWLQRNNELNSNEAGVVYSIRFDYASPELAPPTITNVTPSGNHARIGGTVTVTFDSYLNIEGNVYIKKSGADDSAYRPLVHGVLSAGKLSDTASYTVSYSQLEYDTEYTLKITGFARNFSVVEEALHSFRTGAATDVIPPAVVSVTPSGMQVDFTTDELVITFDEPMDTTVIGTIELYNVYTFDLVNITNGRWNNDGTVYSGTVALRPSLTYEIDIRGFQDLAGNLMVEQSVIFLTDDDASGFRVENVIFNNGNKDSMNGNEYTVGTFKINFSNPIGVVGTVTLNGEGIVSDKPYVTGNAVEYNYTGLTPGAEYTLTISGFKNSNGIEMAEDTFTFTASAFVIPMFYARAGNTSLYANSETFIEATIPFGMPVSYVTFEVAGGYDVIGMKQIPVEELDFVSLETNRLEGAGSIRVNIGDFDIDGIYQISINAIPYGESDNQMGYTSVTLTVQKAPPAQPVSPIITVSANEGGIISTLNNLKTATAGTRVYFYAIPDENYMLDNFETIPEVIIDRDVGDRYFFTMPDEHVKIHANYVRTEYSLNLAVNDNSRGTIAVTPEKSTYAYNELVGLTVTPKDGYYFSGWMLSNGAVAILENHHFRMPASDLEITATFEPYTYKAMARAGKGGTVIETDGASDVVQASSGEQVSFTAIAEDGYQFKGWRVMGGALTLTGDEGATLAFIMPEGNVTVEAMFIPTLLGIEMNRTGLNLPVGESFTLIATAVPTGAEIGSLTWSSNDPSIATVDQNGLVTAIKAGETTVSVTNGEISAQCVVTVKNKSTNPGGTIVPTQPDPTKPEEPNPNPSESEKVVVTLDEEAMKSISAFSGDLVTGASLVDINELNLNKTIADKIGDRPVYAIHISKGGTEINTVSSGNIKISIPYEPSENEDINALVVYSIDQDGSARIIRGYYNAESGMMEFAVKSISTYGIGYNPITFTDVSVGHGSKEAISFIAAREITLGIGNNLFAPDMKLTRGQFLVMVMRAYGIEADANLKNNFIDAGDMYYTAYLATAKHLGIANGVGNNRFAPEKELTREEMIVLVYNILNILGELPQAKEEAKPLNEYADTHEVSDWAIEAVQALVESETIVGDGISIFPQNTSVRYQVAQVLYNLLSAN